MTVEDIKSADIESLEEWFEDGTWKSFPEDAQRELLARISDYRVRNSGEWDTPIEEVFKTPKVQKMIRKGFFDDMEEYLIDPKESTVNVIGHPCLPFQIFKSDSA